MKKLFTNDKFFSAVTWIAIIGILISDGIYLVKFSSYYMMSALQDFICVICLLCIYVSYREHGKNVMKGMMGALLMAILIQFISWLSTAYTSTVIEVVLNCISTLCACLLFVNHFIINGSRQASPLHIRFNQFIVLIFAVIEVVKNILYSSFYSNIITISANIIWAIAYSCIMISIVCIESRLDAYRIDREKAGWTEEKGYPENYVHEYEKKNNK